MNFLDNHLCVWACIARFLARLSSVIVATTAMLISEGRAADPELSKKLTQFEWMLGTWEADDVEFLTHWSMKLEDVQPITVKASKDGLEIVSEYEFTYSEYRGDWVVSGVDRLSWDEAKQQYRMVCSQRSAFSESPVVKTKAYESDVAVGGNGISWIEGTGAFRKNMYARKTERSQYERQLYLMPYCRIRMAVANPDWQEPNLSPELQVLSWMMGKWRVAETLDPAEGTEAFQNSPFYYFEGNINVFPTADGDSLVITYQVHEEINPLIQISVDVTETIRWDKQRKKFLVETGSMTLELEKVAHNIWRANKGNAALPAMELQRDVDRIIRTGFRSTSNDSRFKSSGSTRKVALERIQ